MNEPTCPAWALRTATSKDRLAAQRLHKRNRLQIKWPRFKEIRGWARRQGWPASWWGFEDTFLKTMLESDENFELALKESGIEISMPIASHTISDEELKRLDALYEETEDMGARHPTRWGELVGELRELRRVAEAGVAVKVEGKTLKSWGSFYDWAHGRYGSLEDGYDSWIGDDYS